jgi:hypothetical protein
MRVHLPARSSTTNRERGGPRESKTYFVGICNKLTLDLLPLLVREQENVLYSMAFEEGFCLGNGCDWKEGLD